MAETPRIPSAAPESVRPAQAGSARQPEAGPSGAAFEALFERLTERAAELQEKSRSMNDAAELPEALDAARASLEDALHLGAELLEAFRAARSAPEADS